MIGDGPDIDVTVLGSANLDVVLSVDAIPAPGETVLATDQAQHPGGKGLNQAVAAARAGARTVMLGAVGDDDAAQVLLTVARDSGVDTSRLRNEPGVSGQAFICVRPDGENAIVVASGANATVRSLSADERVAIASARVLVVQLELPVEAVHEGLSAAREASTMTVLNAAPARPLDRELLDLVDVLVVNVHEARTLAGALGTTDPAGAHPAELAARLSATGAVVVTLGGEGALSLDAAGPIAVPAVPAQAVDTTGAGDTFTGVLAATLAEGADLARAVGRAVAAAALSVEKQGAVSSIPWRAEIEERARG